MNPPGYFEEIRAKAEGNWRTLEANQDLAGPWHRMFQQVQSPRHVLSELLQNADDSGATRASARIVDDKFIFEHDGRDFVAAEFLSLCRFGYSNKRALHTIGFRGVGFKSTFSLGDDVYLSTPTLSVRFGKNRFTEPVWISEDELGRTTTTISVELSPAGARRELEKNLAEWQTNSASLLFFRNIRTLQVGEVELKWLDLGNGPCANSTWLKLEGSDSNPCLLVRSDAESFPAEALEEIQSERILSDGEQFEMPPCSVELLLYGDPRLYVVLPTGVKTNLPFAANAPFVQDTARLKIKDPDSSPTNRWLLERVGRLAANAMIGWLDTRKTDGVEAALAYDLMPNVNRDDTSLEGSCAATVEIAFDEALGSKKFVLTEGNHLASRGEAIEAPVELLDVWSANELCRFLGHEGKATTSRHVSTANRKKLKDWLVVQPVSRQEVVGRLRAVSPSRPNSWRQLLALWSYLSDDIPSREYYGNDLRGLRIVPVQGQPTLFAAAEVIRLGEKRLLESDEDWTFMSGYLKALNPNWNRFLAEQRLIAERQGDDAGAAEVDRVYKLQAHLKLSEASDTNYVMRKVTADFFAADEIPISDSVRLARIAARLGAAVGKDFQFVTRDERLTEADFIVVADESGSVADIVDPKWAEDHILHDSYWMSWSSCSRQEWSDWVESGKASLVSFPPLQHQTREFWSRKDFNAALVARGFSASYEQPYKTQHFELTDTDFDPALWKHWSNLAESDDRFWANLFKLMLQQGPAFWAKALDARASQVATTGSRRLIIDAGILPTWIKKFRDLPCLLDMRGIPRKPFEVMRRTAETMPLLDVEPFIAFDLDTEANRPLFNAIQVRSTPTGPQQILDRIRALAENTTPPVDELEKWYRRLDSLFPSCTTDDVKAIREAFEAEPLILSASQGWVRSHEVFLAASADDMPDAPVIRPSVRDLELWRRIQVAERPNAELILNWLRELPEGIPLTADVARRVRPALARLGVRAWEDTGHWLNIASEWVPTSELSYSVSMRSLARTQELFPAVKRQTADFQMLDYENLDRYPLSDVPSLASCLDEQVSDPVVHSFEPKSKPWLECFARKLTRIEVPSEAEKERLRAAAMRLARTQWRQGNGLETIPYLNGVPVGPARRVPAVWSGQTLYVANASSAQMAAPVAREIARGFGNADAIADAVKFCFERDLGFIEEYLAQEFALSLEPMMPDEPIQESRQSSVQAVVEVETPNAEVLVPQDEPHPMDHSEPKPNGEPARPESEQPTRAHRPVEVRHQNRPEKPSLVERFAAARGLRSDGNGKFVGADGTILVRSDDSVFPWELRSRQTETIQHLLPQEHCLEREPIIVESDVWSLLHGGPESHALLVVSPDGRPILLTGSELRKQLDEGQIALYPARYRLAKVVDSTSARREILV